MSRGAIVGIILVVGLIVLVIANLESCHSGNEPEAPPETEEVLEDEEPVRGLQPVHPELPDTAAVGVPMDVSPDTTAENQP